jgi:hypothetical protein
LPKKIELTKLGDCRFIHNLDLQTISLSYFFDDYYSCYEEQKEFKNAYEAFIWCQEKYPEELKAKFEEVIR